MLAWAYAMIKDAPGFTLLINEFNEGWLEVIMWAVLSAFGIYTYYSITKKWDSEDE